MQIVPMFDKVLVRRLEEETKSPGGIIIPDTSKEKPKQGIVISTGPGKRHPETGVLVEPTVKKGDKILFGKYSVTEVKLNEDDKDLLIIKEDDILAVIQ